MSRSASCALAVLLLSYWGCVAAAPRWIDHASTSGPDVAASGQSRFDDLFLRQDKRYDIPYPFSRLVEFLESRIDNAGQKGVRLVFIPMGRSLQRKAPAPDYFKFPRAVIALEGEPVTVGDAAGEVLEYRLFIAHQPKTKTLEIISYNDTAGRFEFQVVDNYGPGRAAHARPANRFMCLSCHQNAAPIFPMRPWSETSFNADVASRLVLAQPQKFDSLIGLVTADAGVIDVLTERANYLAAAQLIWQKGCQTRSCRRALLRAILQYRLSGEASFDSKHPQYRQDYYAELVDNWEANWPGGLALASSRIVDRNPLGAEPPTIEQDPLSLRPAHATWYRVDPVLARGIVYRLAGFLALADIQRLDRHLIELGESRPAASRIYEASCAFETGKDEPAMLSCGDAGSPEGLQIALGIELNDDDLESIRVIELRVPRDANLLQPAITGLTRGPRQIEATLGNIRSGLSQRLANGDRVESLQLRWDDSLRHGSIAVSITITSDFRFIDEALTRLVDKNEHGPDDALADPVFRRQPVMQALARTLGMRPLQWREPATTASVRNLVPSSGLSGDLALLEPYCSHCHGEASVNPPGFLSGNALESKIEKCAPRILARLRAWRADAEPTVAPMPPPASIAATGTTIERWPQSDHYHRLVASVAKLAARNAYSQESVERSASDYQRLPGCSGAASE